VGKCELALILYVRVRLCIRQRREKMANYNKESKKIGSFSDSLVDMCICVPNCSTGTDVRNKFRFPCASVSGKHTFTHAHASIQIKATHFSPIEQAKLESMKPCRFRLSRHGSTLDEIPE